MANRSYLYSLSNRPTSYEDRPETISCLSEWPYFVPFSYRLLMSGDAQLCASLVSDGFESDPPSKKTKLYAISSEFDLGIARLKRFFSVVRPLTVGTAPKLAAQLDETVAFLDKRRDRYLLLETIELDCMTEEGEAELLACVQNELNNCLQVGTAMDVLPEDVTAAGKYLRKAVSEKCLAPLDAFFGLRLDDDCDNTRDRKTEYPLGVGWWTDVLYYELWNRAQFDANR